MIRLYNTLTKDKQEFKPLVPSEVKMYTCGPTVYDYVHIGNLRSYVMADTLRRVLQESGLTVQHVKNITDVGHLTADDLGQGDSGEDKLVRKAAKEGKTPEAIAAFYTEYYHATEQKLNILPATTEPHATDYVPQMIEFISGLIEKGCAYEKNGNVFFDVTQFPGYGALSGNTLEQLKIGARLEEHPDKKNPWDFALWLRAPEGHLMRWESPWGVGYPGWHIECSAMNLATLGATIDIHTGGEDNIFPHHEAEIAQSECGNGVPFVHYWVHARHLLVDGAKMSKSKGNFYRLEDIEARGYSPMDLRMLYLSAHYRSQMNFTWEALEQARKNKETIINTVERLNQYANAQNPDDTRGSTIASEVDEAMHDDLNTPKALALVLELCRQLNSAMDTTELINANRHIEFFDTFYQLFGLCNEALEISDTLQALLDERSQARADKNFHRSDELRDEFLRLGFVVEDTSTGQRLKRK